MLKALCQPSYPLSLSPFVNSITSPILTSNATQIRLSTDSVTSSSRRSRVMVFGAMPAALRRSALLIFLSMSSFQSLLYEIANTVRSQIANSDLIKQLICQLSNGLLHYELSFTEVRFAQMQNEKQIFAQINRNPNRFGRFPVRPRGLRRRPRSAHRNRRYRRTNRLQQRAERTLLR